LKEAIFRKIVQHQSLYVIAFGAIGFFLTNVILKDKLSAVQYGEFSIVITYFTMIYIYGLLGLEQVFVKYSLIRKGLVIEINRFLTYLIAVAVVFTTIISSAFFLLYYSEIPLNPIVLIVTTFSMVSLLLLFSIFRINSNFVLAQLIVNGFKISLFILILFLLVFDSINYYIILLGISVSIIISFISGIIYLKKNLKIVYNNNLDRNTILTVGFYFLISTMTFSVINFADRFIIDYKLGIEKFGDYFYLSNIFLAPFSLLQNYIGFKKLADYKNEFTVKKFKINNLTNLYIGILLSLVLFVLYHCLVMINYVNFDFTRYRNVILLLLVLGTVKLYSAGIYPAFDLLIKVKYLKISKIFILIGTIVVLGVVYLFVESLEIILIGLILIWIGKTLLLKYILLFQVKSHLVE